MNHRRVLIGAALVTSAALPLACGDTSGTGGASATTTSSSSSASSSASSSKSTAQSSSTGALTCDASKFPGACGTCLQASCCKELADADQKMGLTQALGTCIKTSCPMCVPDKTPGVPQCDVPAAAPSNGACVAIGNGIDCNPVTNAGCSNGDVCDYAKWGFTCYPGTNTQTLCAGCGMSNMFCGAGLTCTNTDAGPAECFRYCCSDADCGGGTCVTNVLYFAPALGLCGASTTSTTSSSSSSANSSSTSGAGGAATTSSASSSSATSSSATSSSATSSSATSSSATSGSATSGSASTGAGM